MPWNYALISNNKFQFGTFTLDYVTKFNEIL